MVVGARTRSPLPSLVAGVLTVIAAVSVDVQLAASASPLVGGNTSSAAFLLAVGVVALALAGAARRRDGAVT